MRFLLVFLLISTYAFAEEEWTITKFDKLSYAAVSGEVTHGDTLNFYLKEKIIEKTISTVIIFLTKFRPNKTI